MGFTKLLDVWRTNNANGRKPIQQFWLPGEWAGLVPYLLFEKSAIEFIKSFFFEVATLTREKLENLPERYPDVLPNSDDTEDIDSFKAFGEHIDDGEMGEVFDEDTHKDFDDLENYPEAAWMKKIRGSAGKVLTESPMVANILNSAKSIICSCTQNKMFTRKIGAFLLALIDTADRIREIARSAIQHNVKVRWFNHESFLENNGVAKGGNSNLLVPINARELRQLPKVRNIFKHLCLSSTNERCLSFYSPSKDSWRSAVLFCGDSPMGYASGYSVPFKLRKNLQHPFVIATAPHHGRETNKGAYSHIKRWIAPGCVFWVKGGCLNDNPGPTFRSLNSVLRGCTVCPHSNKTYRAVEITENRQYGAIQNSATRRTTGATSYFKGHQCSC